MISESLTPLRGREYHPLLMKVGIVTAALLILLDLVPACAVNRSDNGPPAGPPKTYYVATSGSDSSSGLSPSSEGGSNGPFRTLRHAASVVKAGDTVQIRGGTYQETSSWSADGTETSPITITNYGDEIPVIDGNGNTIPSEQYGVLLGISGDWVTVRNIEIAYSGYYGLMVSGDHCTVDNVYCHHSYAAGITTSGSYALVQNCRAWYNATRNEFGKAGEWSTGISITGSSPEHSTIRKCTAWQNWGQGIKAALSYHATIEDCVAYDNMYNFYVRDSKYCTFQRNLSYCTDGGLMEQHGVDTVPLLYGDETETRRSSDNVFINNMIQGGTLYAASIGSGTFENCLFANNTIVNASSDPAADLTVRIGSGTYSNARFLDNIILQEGSVDICANGASGVTFGRNLWSRTPPSNCRGPEDITGDPILAKAGPTGPGLLTPEWFKISASSPARDRAKALAEVKEDFFKTLRGNAPDIGAHEIPK